MADNVLYITSEEASRLGSNFLTIYNTLLKANIEIKVDDILGVDTTPLSERPTIFLQKAIADELGPVLLSWLQTQINVQIV